jgi:Domain of unknown function (DUF4920)
MKKLTAIFAIAMLGLASCGQKSETKEGNQEAAAATTETGNFGAKIDETGAIGMDSLVAMMSTAKGEISGVKVTGKVAECCQTKGCWMNIDKGDGSGMRVTFKDYGFFVPKSSGGKTAVFTGKAYMDTTSVDDLRHYAQDEGLSEAEINKITEPKIELSFEADGVIIK